VNQTAPDLTGSSDPDRATLERALAGLSAADREVIVLRVVLELDAAETARLLGISATACTTRLNRALQRLEDRMESNALA
jgi:RNA polymerase sigma factor (sigma-70 family)